MYDDNNFYFSWFSIVSIFISKSNTFYFLQIYF